MCIAGLALCAGCVAAYGYTGGAVGRLRPRFTLVFCGLAVFLSLVAMVRGEEPGAYRLFWLAGAVQFCLSAIMLLRPRTPAPADETAEGPAAEQAEAGEPAADESDGPGEEL